MKKQLLSNLENTKWKVMLEINRNTCVWCNSEKCQTCPMMMLDHKIESVFNEIKEKLQALDDNF